MARFIDLSGKRFERWIVLKEAGKNKQGSTIWKCQCECGTIKNVVGSELTRGKSKSCGCLNKEKAYKLKFKHGLSRNRIIRIFGGMKQRCYNNKKDSYPAYGGRGITICKEWMDDPIKFYEWSINNGYKENFSIDRIDNDKGYSPENCRWTTPTNQSRNTRGNKLISYNNVVKTLIEWSEEYNIPYSTLESRIRRKWPIHEALTTPKRS